MDTHSLRKHCLISMMMYVLPARTFLRAPSTSFRVIVNLKVRDFVPQVPSGYGRTMVVNEGDDDEFVLLCLDSLQNQEFPGRTLRR